MLDAALVRKCHGKDQCGQWILLDFASNPLVVFEQSYVCIATGYQNFKVLAPTSYLTKTISQSPDSDNSLISKTQKGWFFNCFQIPRLGYFFKKKQTHLTFALHPSWLIEMVPKSWLLLRQVFIRELGCFLGFTSDQTPAPPGSCPPNTSFQNQNQMVISKIKYSHDIDRNKWQQILVPSKCYKCCV
jgi:hypothetical protein